MADAQKDLELEARCEYWLGKINEKALRKEDDAIRHYNAVHRLAVVMRPKDITNTLWYKEALSSKESIQSRRKLEEEAAKDKADA